MRKILLVGISTFALGAGAMAYANQQTKAPKADTFKMLELFGDVLSVVEQQYVVPVDDKKLIQAAIDGMLTSLDPHSGYLDAQNFDEMRDQTRGEYGGLGIVVQAEDGAVKVVSPMDGTPAGKAGILAGDYITAIDGQSHHRPLAERRGQGHARRGGHHHHPDHGPREAGRLLGQADPRSHQCEVGHRPGRRRLRLYPPVRLRREDRRGDPCRDQGPEGQDPAHEGHGARPAQQPRRSGRLGRGRGLGLPGRRRSGVPARPRRPRHRPLQTPRPTAT